jgi:BirA family biotin operon repressor/biotin-[acetyl-CoA-carboxylase] ligase
VSILLRPRLDPADLHLVTTAVGVAAAAALDEVAGVPVRLKWPNDLVVVTAAGERKLGGILAEAVWSGEHLDAVVVGLGLNVTWPAELPDELADLAVALNHLTDRPVDRSDLLEALLGRLEPLLVDLASDDLIEAWRARSATLGRAVRVELASGEVVEGEAVDLTASGHLLVRTEGGTEEVLAGDVFHLRPG